MHTSEPAEPAYDEVGLLFNCAGETLVGVLARPPSSQLQGSLGVVIIVGGPQYRAGSHRQFVSLARALAAAGHAVLRFDYRGMGDSSGAPRDFLQVHEDIGAAIDALQAAAPSVRRVALWGLCDAASAALLYCRQSRDPRVDLLVLLNPWVRSAQGLARVQVKHYYRQRLLEPAFWRKLLSGRVARTALTELAGALRTMFANGSKTTEAAAVAEPFPDRMAAALSNFEGNVFLLLSENDFTAKEFVDLSASHSAWQQALSHPALMRTEIAGADHTLSESAHTRLMEQAVASWLTAAATPAKIPAASAVALTPPD